MDTRQLEIFMAVAQAGSMTAAAQGLYMTVPAVVQQMNRLEKELEVTLFRRNSKGVVLTDAGCALQEDAKRMLTISRQMVERCRSIDKRANNVVTIGSVAGLVPDFYPEIQRIVRKKCPQIHLCHVEETYEQLCEAMLEGALDMIEYYDAPLHDERRMCYVPLIYEGRCCLMAPDHPLADRKSIRIEDLTGQNVFVHDFERVPGFAEYAKARCHSVHVQSQGRSVTGYYSVLELCNEGDLCLIPPHCANHFSPLVAVPIDMELTWSGGLICLKDMKPAAQQVLDVIREAYASIDGLNGV